MGEKLLIQIVTVLLLGLFFFKISNKILNKYLIVPYYAAKKLFSWAIRNSEVKRKILITVGILLVVKILTLCVPLPLINADVISRFIDIDFLFNSSAMSFVVFGLGLIPLFSACLLLQVASILIPPLRRMLFGGEAGRTKLITYTYIITVCLSLIHAYGLSLALEKFLGLGMGITTTSAWEFRILATITMTAAVVVLLFVAGLINRYGIGNGIALIVVSATVFEIIYMVYQIFANATVPVIVMFLILIAAFIYFAVSITIRSKSVELQNISKQQTISVPIRVSWVAKQPLVWAGTILLLPATLAQFFPNIQKPFEFLIQNNWLNIFMYAVLIFVFTYLYSLIIFKPGYVQDLMDKYGYVIPSIEKENAKKYLKNNLFIIQIVTGIFLFITMLIPYLISKTSEIPYSITSIIVLGSGAGLLGLIGVCYDLICQITFFKEKDLSGVKQWEVCYVAFDEIEAEMIRGYLKGNGIDVLVEPIRFTWGIPIRTIIDQYRIYTHLDKTKEARGRIN